MRLNVLVVETASTWLLIEDVPGGEEGIEAFLSQPSDNDDEATRNAEAELARFRDGQTQISVGIDPEGSGDVPFDDFGIGDLADVDGAERRTLTLTFSRDAQRHGRLVFVPQFGDIIDSPTVAQQKMARRMMPGALGGASLTAARPAVVQESPVDATVRTPIVEVTQAEYDALDPVLPGVLYVIVS